MALIHDFLLDLRGAERVFMVMCDLWPDADIFTAIYDEDGTEGRFADREVHTSFLQRLRPSARTFRTLLPLYPAAMESLDLSTYDLVVSSSSAWAHAVVCDPETVHVSYCHNPFRYAWNDRDSTLARRPEPVSRAMLRGLFRRWRQWDWIAAQRVDRYVTNSGTTQARVKAYFGRDSTVVYPPVETHRFSPATVGDHYVVLSELMPHKQIDKAVRAFNALGFPLQVIGDGPDAARLQRLAGPTVTFTGRIGDTEVARRLSGCRALVVTAVEEFGIAAVEAQAAGRPVIAAGAGGALETVIDGATGCFWSGDSEHLAATVADFDDAAVDPADCVENAARFDTRIFQERLPRQVEKAIAASQPRERLHADRVAGPSRLARRRRARHPSPGER